MISSETSHLVSGLYKNVSALEGLNQCCYNIAEVSQGVIQS